MTGFTLHERLAADTIEIADWDLCRVRLMNDRTYPWLILVPMRDGLVELFDVAQAEHALLMAEIGRAGRALQRLHAPDKLNVAAIGNVVAQLHVHVVARTIGDPAWPGPVWGAAPPVPYDDAGRAAVVAALRRAFA